MMWKAAGLLSVLFFVSAAQAENCNTPFLTPQEIAESILSAEERIQVELGEELISEALAGSLYADLQKKKDKLIAEVGEKAYQELLENIAASTGSGEFQSDSTQRQNSLEVEFLFEETPGRKSIKDVEISGDAKKIMFSHHQEGDFNTIRCTTLENVDGGRVNTEIGSCPRISPGKNEYMIHRMEENGIEENDIFVTRTKPDLAPRYRMLNKDDSPHKHLTTRVFQFRNHEDEWILKTTGRELTIWEAGQQQPLVQYEAAKANPHYRQFQWTSDGEGVLIGDKNSVIHLLDIKNNFIKSIMPRNTFWPENPKYSPFISAQSLGVSMNFGDEHLWISLAGPNVAIARWDIENKKLETPIELVQGAKIKAGGFDPTGRYYWAAYQTPEGADNDHPYQMGIWRMLDFKRMELPQQAKDHVKKASHRFGNYRFSQNGDFFIMNNDFQFTILRVDETIVPGDDAIQ